MQIRTQAMHEHAEHGVAAHWAYKEAGAKGYAGVQRRRRRSRRRSPRRARPCCASCSRGSATSSRQARRRGADGAAFDDRIYVFTPQAAIVELPAGATPIDFAYAVHTDLGHRCRGAKVDGVMVPLNTPLRSGQTVEVIDREGGRPVARLAQRRARLPAELARSKAKVRAWFNALAQTQTIARGREAVEKLLQREGKTALKLDDLAAQLGFRNADALFEVVGKDEFSLRNIETLLRPAEPLPTPDEVDRAASARAPSGERAEGRRAGGRRRVAADEPGALLPAGAARCDRRLRDARQGRGGPPRELQQLPPDGASARRSA